MSSILVWLSFLLTVSEFGGDSRPPIHASNPKRTFAAVYLVRGSVSGSHTGNFGVFTRNGNDTTWTFVNPSSIIAFGLGYFERVSTRRHYIAAGNGVHRSTDGGTTWRILTSWHTMEILGVVPDPYDSALIYAATPWGMYRTTDDGATWELKDKGTKRWFVQQLHMDLRDRSTLYAVMEDDLYRTTDGGESWTPVNVGGTYPQVVAQHPVDPSFLCVGFGDGSIRCSMDDGRSWKRAGEVRGEAIYALRFSPDGTSLLAAGWRTGVWRSLDRGTSWAQIWDNPAVEGVFDVAVDPDNSRHLIIATDGQGVYESLDEGRTWSRAGLMGAKVKRIEFYP